MKKQNRNITLTINKAFSNSYLYYVLFLILIKYILLECHSIFIVFGHSYHKSIFRRWTLSSYSILLLQSYFWRRAFIIITFSRSTLTHNVTQGTLKLPEDTESELKQLIFLFNQKALTVAKNLITPFICLTSVEHFDISCNKAVLVQYLYNSLLQKKMRGYMQPHVTIPRPILK